MLLYYMDVSELDFNRIKSSVSKTRIKKSSKYFHRKDRNLSLGVEVLLNHALNKIGINNPVFDIDKYGKPYLKNYSDVYFNLSHSQKYVACAVSDSPVGVDIEYIHDIDLNLSKHFFYGSEYEHILNNNNQNNAFFELWVLKESYMKMTGLGFRLALDEFCIEISDEIKLIHNENTGKFGLWSVCGGDYMLGVCSKSKITEPELINLRDIWG
ncbi:4'-phosphopantetheinyl transferase family protein [Methanobacterium sp.]|uniref:4'-phosphopantetheinyl transferase family protein n=1 Tax=Methanobacterium sp. TaxID=2164 RepID=UPI003C75638D